MLFGPNGAGKSTMIGIISSLVNKSSGKVNILGLDIDTHHSQAKKRIGIVGQEVNLINLKQFIIFCFTKQDF